MKRVMCVWLPQWPLQRLQHEQPDLRDKPVVIVHPVGRRGPQVVYCSRGAARAGIRPGMPLAEAQAIERDVRVCVEDRDGDRRALERLAVWAARYSPFVGVEESPAPHSLLLDVTGCAACFHGEDQLLRRAAGESAAEGWQVRVSLADTIGAAWALAHHAKSPLLAPPGNLENLLAPLPLAALRLPADAAGALAGLGIDRIEQLLHLQRSSIPTRFGDEVLRRLDQALGRLPELLVPHRFLSEVRAVYPFAFATDRLGPLRQALYRVAEQIQAMLQSRRWGARHIECLLYFETAPPLKIETGLSRPSASAVHLGALLGARLEEVRLAEPVRALALRVAIAEPMADSQADFFENDYTAELSVLIDRLSNRLGRDAVTRPTLVADAQPEYACRFEPLVKNQPRWQPPTAVDPPPPRPVRLWPRPCRIQVMSTVPEGPPVRFRWSGAEYRITASRGPERIETGWWRGDDVRRDYYTVGTHLGSWFWIFRRHDDGRWFLHGCFD